VLVSHRPTALILAPDTAACPLIRAALGEMGMPYSRVDVFEEDIDEELLDGHRLAVLCDVPLAVGDRDKQGYGITPDGQRALLRWVRGGGGLLVAGGAFGLGPGYAGQPLARALPVLIEDQGTLEDPSVALVMALDSSGSMTELVDGYEKMALAVEASLAAAANLGPGDRAGIAAVDVQTRWLADLAAPADLAARSREIRRVAAAGGGIFTYNALLSSYARLRRSPQTLKHLILFADANDAQQQCRTCGEVGGGWLDVPTPGEEAVKAGRPVAESALELVQLAAGDGITTTVVALGRQEDRDTPFLRSLAVAGKGRFHLTRRGAGLRRIFVAETRAQVRSNLQRGRARVQTAIPHPMLGPLDLDDIPALRGFVMARRRPLAKTVLSMGAERPLLATWRYGTGRVTTLAADAGGALTPQWATSTVAGQLLRQIARHTTPQRPRARVDVRIKLDGHAATVDVEVPALHIGVLQPDRVELTSVLKSGVTDTSTLPLDRLVPGRLRAMAARTGEHGLVARVLAADGEVLAEAVAQRQAANELTHLGADERLLRRIAERGGGLVDPSYVRTLRAGGPARPRKVPSWPWVLLLAASLVCADLWLRRLPRGAVRTEHRR